MLQNECNMKILIVNFSREKFPDYGTYIMAALNNCHTFMQSQIYKNHGSFKQYNISIQQALRYASI